MKRKLLITFLSALALFGTLFVLREQISIAATRLLLSRVLGERLSYRTISASDGSIAIDELMISEERAQIAVPRLVFSFDWGEILMHPKSLIALMRAKDPHWSNCLVAMNQYGVKLDIDKGTLLFSDIPYHFTFARGERAHEIGILRLFLDFPAVCHSFAAVQLHVRGEQLISQLKIDEVESVRLFPLASFLFPGHLSGWTSDGGTVQMHASAIFGRGGEIDEISTYFKTAGLRFTRFDSPLVFRCDHLKGECNYPEGLDDPSLPLWKRMDCNVKLEGGCLSFSDTTCLTGVDGTLGLDPREDPALLLMGQFDSRGKRLAMQLRGKGVVHEDDTHWLDFDLDLDDRQGTLCSTSLSLCRPDAGSHLLQLEAVGLLPEQVEMFKNYFAFALPRASDWKVVEGTFSGKLIALFEQRALSRFEVSDLHCEKVQLLRQETPFYFADLKGEGRIFEELQLAVTMPISHFFGLGSEQLRAVYEVDFPDDSVHLSSHLVFSPEGVETAASVTFPSLGQALQFGFRAPVALPRSLDEIEQGWVRGAQISHELYTPLVRIAQEDLVVFGTVDCVGSYDGKTIDLALQVDDLLVKHPFLDLKAERIGEKDQTVGRAKFSFDPATSQFYGTLPLQHASAYERRLGLLAEELDATIALSSDRLEGQIERVNLSFDGTPLLRETAGKFSLGETFAVEEMRGRLPFETDRDLILALDRWTPQLCEAALFDGDQQWAHFSMTREGDWRGKVELAGFERALEASFSWNLIGGDCQLALLSEEMELLAKRVGAQCQIERFAMGGVTSSAALAIGEEGLELRQFAVSKGELHCKGKGSCLVDVPQMDSPLAIRSCIEVEATYGKESPLTFASVRPFLCAFSPQLGWLVTDLSLACGDNTFAIGQFEHHINSQAVCVRKGEFFLTKALCSELIDKAVVLPDLLTDFRIDRGVKGAGHLTVEGNKLSLTAELDTGFGPWHTALDWGRESGTIAFGRGRELVISAHLDETNALQFDAIEGTLGEVKAHLKRKAADEELRGTLELPFALFDRVIDLPLNQYLSAWKLGGGCLFEGSFNPASHLRDWGFKGKVKGRSITCCGCAIEGLQARLEIGPEKILVENLDVTDDAGKAWVGEGAITYADGHWQFAFPLVELRSFQPSFLRRLTGLEQPITPLVVKSASLFDVMGRVDDPRSLSASGNLTFTNLSGRAAPPLPKNLPTTVLKQMGLDGKLFVPVSGQMEYLIQGGRCYLRNLQNVISEKRRSEFGPPRNGVMGYVDFDGNLYIDMHIRQRVVPSISGPIFVTVRGHFDNPEITIR